MGYFDRRQEWEHWFPADLVIESLPGQFRNWFYVLLAMSAMLEGRKPVSTMMGHSSVVDEQGEEMHKSRGNAVWFSEAADRMGADVVRWICASQPLTQPLRFGWGGAEEVRDWLRTLWNVYSFLATYAKVDRWPEAETYTALTGMPPQSALDRWLRLRTALTTQAVFSALESLNPPRATTALLGLLDDLSNWWVRRSRRRFWKSGSDADKQSAYRTLHTALFDFSRLLAPFVPFTAEALYQRLVAPFEGSFPESVHLCELPASHLEESDRALLDECTRAQAAVRLGRALRAEVGVRVRQPLARALILNLEAPGTSAFPHFAPDVREELNVRSVQFVSTKEQLASPCVEGPHQAVGLDTQLTDDLIAEGIARDLVRHIQNLRKHARLRVDQRISLWIEHEGAEAVGRALRTYDGYVAAETLATQVTHGAGPARAASTECTVAGRRVTLAIVAGEDAWK